MFAKAHVDAVICSPLQRARQTAEPTVDATGSTLACEDAFVDRDYGPWAGKAHADVEPRYGSLDRAPEIEPMASFVSRVVLGAREGSSCRRVRTALVRAASRVALLGGLGLRAAWSFLSVAEVDVGERAVEPAGEVPVAVAEEGHGGGDEQDADDGGVEEDGHGEGEAELGGWDGSGHAEGDEHDDHDERGVGDGPSGAGDAVGDGAAGVAGGFVAFADRGQQEQLVVHGEAEEQREEEEWRPGVDEGLVFDAEQAGADAVLEHERRKANAAPTVRRFMRMDMIATTRLRNTRSSSTKAMSRMSPIAYGRPR